MKMANVKNTAEKTAKKSTTKVEKKIVKQEPDNTVYFRQSIYNKSPRFEITNIAISHDSIIVYLL